MAFDNSNLDSFGIETLKAIAKDMKSKLNLRDPLSKMSKDSLISFIANNQNSNYRYEGELPEKGTRRPNKRAKAADEETPSRRTLASSVRVSSRASGQASGQATEPTSAPASDSVSTPAAKVAASDFELLASTVKGGDRRNSNAGEGEDSRVVGPNRRLRQRRQKVDLVDEDNRPLNETESGADSRNYEADTEPCERDAEPASRSYGNANRGRDGRSRGHNRRFREDNTSEAERYETGRERQVATTADLVESEDYNRAAVERVAVDGSNYGEDESERSEDRPRKGRVVRLHGVRAPRDDRRQERMYAADDRFQERDDREEGADMGRTYRERRPRLDEIEDSVYEDRGSRSGRSRIGRNKGRREMDREYESSVPRFEDDLMDRGYGREDEEREFIDGDYAYDEERSRFSDLDRRGAGRESDAYSRYSERDYDDEGYGQGRGGRFSRPDRYESERYDDEPSQPTQSMFATGVLELKPDGAGMLRGITFKPRDCDVFVPVQLIKAHGLRVGDMVTGIVRQPKPGDSFFTMQKVTAVNDMDPAKSKRRPVFDQLVPIYPNQRYVLEYDTEELTTRIIDLFSPLGRGQRCLIVAPPKAGKTIMLKHIAMGIRANCKDAIMMALLVDERPEEVTDMARTIEGTVVASTFDEPYEQHIRMSNLVMERARRLVELGNDVVIIMDSLTRLGRACNNAAPTSGRTMSGGLDISALRMPKHLFGSARNIENGGSLTIIATALIETGSKMDEVIFEEFKGTGNMEINLSRKLSERRIFPAIDLLRSGTRHDELLYRSSDGAFWFANTIRQQISTAGENDYKHLEAVIKAMKAHPQGGESNAEFVERIKNQQRKD